MPNWCEGNIRFRGAKKNIKRFILNEIVYCEHVFNGTNETIEKKPIIEDNGYCMIITKPNEHSWFYIKGTRRNFFETEVLEIWMEEENDDKEIIVCIDNFRVAWSFEKCEKWREFVKQYDFDVKMTGYERGMHFSQIKTILRDGHERDTIHEYESDDDWMWNCPLPNNGG